jgi:hypothetical protein
VETHSVLTSRSAAGSSVASLAFLLFHYLFHPNLVFPTAGEIRGVDSTSERSERLSPRPPKTPFPLANQRSPCFLRRLSRYLSLDYLVLSNVWHFDN